MKTVVGKKVSISLGEPWDFPYNPIMGVVRKSYTTILSSEKDEKIRESLLIQAVKPFSFQNLKNEYFIASLRYVGETIHDFLVKGKLTIGIHHIPEIVARSDNPFESKPSSKALQSWGGIGSIKIET